MKTALLALLLVACTEGPERVVDGRIIAMTYAPSQTVITYGGKGTSFGSTGEVWAVVVNTAYGREILRGEEWFDAGVTTGDSVTIVWSRNTFAFIPYRKYLALNKIGRIRPKGF